MRQLNYSGSIAEYSCDILPTVRSGQTFQWSDMNKNTFPQPDSRCIYTTLSSYDSPTNESEYIELNLSEKEWNSTFDAKKHLQKRFREEEDWNNITKKLCKQDRKFTEIQQSSPHNLHLISDPLFPTLISFICSSQMSISRIHQMQQNLASEYGDVIRFTNREVSIYPTPYELSQSTTEELQNLKLGYRSRYVKTTATQISQNMSLFETLKYNSNVEDARTQLKQYLGVGTKVADCILLYSLNFSEVVPIDTWIESLATELYGLSNKSKSELQQHFQNIWGEYAGYAQLYGFVYAQQKL